MKTLITLLILAIASTATASIRYERVDGNQVRRIVENEVVLDARILQAEINTLDREIDATPEEVLMPSNRVQLIEERDEKVAILNTIIAVR